MDAIDKINIFLAQKGMTGAELERKIGASNSVYSQWNTKTTKPSNKSLVKVAAVLGVDVSEIMPDKKLEKLTREDEPMSLDALRALSKEELYELMNNVVKALKEKE